jgi:hypothetical protein
MFRHSRTSVPNSGREKIVTGCNNADKANRVIYDIHFASGDTFGLGYAEPAKKGCAQSSNRHAARDIAHQRWSP